MQDRLLAEASTAAWQDYFLFNALLAIICLFPALPFWRREKYRAPTTPTSKGVPASQALRRDNPARTS